MRGRLEDKRVSESTLTACRLMLPTDSNPVGYVHGGSIVRYVDEIAGVVAFRHCRTNVVTASIDSMSFLAPVHIGNLLIVKASINYVGRTSMEVGARVEAEDLVKGVTTHTGSCYLTFVALDENGRPTRAPPIIPVTKGEKRRYKEAQERRTIRLSTRNRKAHSKS